MRALLSIVFLSACATPNFCTTGLGVTHVEPPVGCYQFGAQEEFLYRHLVGDYGWDARKLREAFSVAEVNWGADTWTTEGRMISANPNQADDWCDLLGRYRHELLHELGAYRGTPDKHHKGPWWALADPDLACLDSGGGP